MRNIGAWLRQIAMAVSGKLRIFMSGRYGTDKLNTTILSVAVVICLISVFFKFPVLILLAYILLFWAMFRSFSRNTYKRYRENRRFLMFIDRIRDRQHRYYTCPKCRQPVRVPRGKGKIAITCPKCQEKFIRKT